MLPYPRNYLRPNSTEAAAAHANSHHFDVYSLARTGRFAKTGTEQTHTLRALRSGNYPFAAASGSEQTYSG